MTIKRVFKNTMPGTQYLFKNGKSAVFTNGRYETDIDWEIAELDEEIRQGIPHIYIDPKDTTVDTGQIDFIRQRQIEATKQAIRDYEEAKNKGEAPAVNEVPTGAISRADIPGTVDATGYAKEPDGTLVKPGADEAQRVQLDRNDVPVPDIGAAKEIKTSEHDVTIVNAPPTNMAKLLALKQAAATEVKPTNTGIATSANNGGANSNSAS